MPRSTREGCITSSPRQRRPRPYADAPTVFNHVGLDIIVVHLFSGLAVKCKITFTFLAQTQLYSTAKSPLQPPATISWHTNRANTGNLVAFLWELAFSDFYKAELSFCLAPNRNRMITELFRLTLTVSPREVKYSIRNNIYLRVQRMPRFFWPWNSVCVCRYLYFFIVCREGKKYRRRERAIGLIF